MTAKRTGLNLQMNNNIYFTVIQMLIPFKCSGIPYSHVGRTIGQGCRILSHFVTIGLRYTVYCFYDHIAGLDILVHTLEVRLQASVLITAFPYGPTMLICPSVCMCIRKTQTVSHIEN